ncbi:MAG: ABC transporter ATP-binding protein [bacterium]
MLEVTNIQKKYGSVVAVNGVDVFLNKGEIIVILGASGCGKTTLLRLIAGFEEPDAGSIYIDGLLASSIDTMIPPHKRKLGMIFQDLALWPHMTVKEHINFGLRGEGLSKRQREEKIRETMKFVSLPDHLHRYPHQLSGGQRQRLAIARTISLEPSIILMDEPLSNLDPDLKNKIRDVILKMKEALQISILYVTHDHDDALLLADRVAIMNHGRIKKIGKKEEIMDQLHSKK